MEDLKCEFCGANATINTDFKTYTCPYCGRTGVIPKEMEQYARQKEAEYAELLHRQVIQKEKHDKAIKHLVRLVEVNIAFFLLVMILIFTSEGKVLGNLIQFINVIIHLMTDGIILSYIKKNKNIDSLIKGVVICAVVSSCAIILTTGSGWIAVMLYDVYVLFCIYRVPQEKIVNA